MSSISDNRSSLKEFLASIATIKGDLSNITAPPFVLATKSAVEFPAYWAEQPGIFVAPAAEPEPQKRALLVLKWFLAALKQQQYAGRDEKDGVKKPLNAFLGEIFLARWEDEATGETRLVSEQVSHHPPVTACYLWNEQRGVRAEGYTCQEITFSGSVNIKQIGHAILHLDKHNEDYLIPLPNVKVKGLLTGTPYPELTGTYHISSSNGFISEIDFTGKSMLGLSGTKNKFEATLYRDGEKPKPLYRVSGTWNEQFTIHDVVAGTDLDTYNTNIAAATPLLVGDLATQDSWESRKAWAGVIDALNHGDMRGTSDEKNKIEEAQRAQRKKEEQEGIKWKPLFFQSVEDDKVFQKLAAPVGVQLGAERTVGVWKVDHATLADTRKPYHGDLTPLC